MFENPPILRSSMAGSRTRRLRLQTVSVDDSTPSIVYPGPPFNSPQIQLTANISGINLNAAAEDMLQDIPYRSNMKRIATSLLLR